MSSPNILMCVAAAALLAAGCGKKEASTTAPAAPSSTAAPAASTTAPAANAPRVLELTGNDQMKFNMTRLEAKAGETVRVVLRNAGVLPKAAMGHNFVLLKSGVSVEEFATAAITAGAAKDYFPTDRAAQTIAHTKLLGPNEKAEVTFTVPAEAGEYSYLCTFPGHFAAGMRGVLVVTK